MPLNIDSYLIQERDIRMYEQNSVIRNGLVLHLDASIFNTVTYGTTWFDLSGNGNNGTMVNGSTYSGVNGGSLTFDGIDECILIDVDSWIRTRSTAYTFSSFFYYNDSENGGAPYSLLNSPNSDNESDGFWQHLDLGVLDWVWRVEDNSAGESGGTVQSPSPFSNGNWYYLVTVVKTNGLIFYLNNNLISTISTTFSWSNLRTDRTAYLYLASGYGQQGHFMNGKIGNFQLYDKELSAAEIAHNYNVTKGRFGL
jgi:hypothetical protein